MLRQKDLEEYILSFEGAWLDYPFGEKTAVYKIGPRDGENKMFALIEEGSYPAKLSLKCDPQLAAKLREEYETVLPGFHLNKKHWNTIICSGQLKTDQIHDLIRHSYILVSESL